jgi:hypothetical protein
MRLRSYKLSQSFSANQAVHVKNENTRDLMCTCCSTGWLASPFCIKCVVHAHTHTQLHSNTMQHSPPPVSAYTLTEPFTDNLEDSFLSAAGRGKPFAPAKHNHLKLILTSKEGACVGLPPLPAVLEFLNSLHCNPLSCELVLNLALAPS